MRFSVLSLLAGAAVAAAGSLDSHTWMNWDKRMVAHPNEIIFPASEDEVVALVKQAVQAGAGLKVVGAGHSFSAIALTQNAPALASDAAPEWMVSLDKMQDVLGRDGDLVTVEAGIRLFQLNAELETRGLALANLGATAEQSLAGAIATGTHGTGARFGSISTQVVSLRIVTAAGEVVVVDGGEELSAARVALGALGVVTSVTLAAVPLATLELVTEPWDLDDLLAALPRLLEQYPLHSQW